MNMEFKWCFKQLLNSQKSRGNFLIIEVIKRSNLKKFFLRLEIAADLGV